MKKRLIIALMLALVMVLVPSSVAFAWEYEDQQINRNAQMDDGKTRGYSLADMLDNGQGNTPIYPDAGDHIYVDTYSQSGDLASLSILKKNGKRVRKYSTEEMALADPGHDNDQWMSYDGAMFYFAPEPMGYNLPPTPLAPAKEGADRHKGLSGVFWVEVLNFSGFDTFKWDNWGSFDRVLAEPVVAYNRVNGLIVTLYIPEGTHLSYPGRPYTLVTNLFIEKDDSGGVFFEPGNMDFSQPCSLTLAYSDGTEEVVTFTEIRDGLPVPISEVVPSYNYTGKAVVLGT